MNYSDLEIFSYHDFRSEIENVNTISCDDFICVTICYKNGKRKSKTINLLNEQSYHDWLVNKIFNQNSTK